MSAFGLSNAGKEAEGWPRGAGAWSQEQMKQWLQQQQEHGATADDLVNWATQYQKERAEKGIGTPAEIRALGEQILPGITNYISNQQGRTAATTEAWNKLPKAADTMATVNAATDELGGNIQRAFTQTEGEINDTARRMFEREQKANEQVNADITGRYNKMDADARGVYGELIDRNASTYGDLRKSSDEAFAESFKDVEQLKPGSEFAMARAGRAFAPAMASTAGRLRRMGVDPSSAQGLSALQRVENARSRSMDDQAAQGVKDYVGSKTDLRMAQQENREGLGIGELDRHTKLSADQEAILRQISREQGGLTREEALRYAQANNLIDRDRSGRSVANIDTSFDRTAGYLDDRKDNALLDRGLTQEDWETESRLRDQVGSDEKEAINLRGQEFGAGMNYRTQDLARRDAGAAAVQGIGEGERNNQFRSAATAGGWMDNASKNYERAYNLEAPNAGWATKLIAGMGGQALNAVAPGLGTVVTGAVPIPGQQQQQGGQGTQQQPMNTGQPGQPGQPTYPGTPPFVPPQQQQPQPQKGNWFQSWLNRIRRPSANYNQQPAYPATSPNS